MANLMRPPVVRQGIAASASEAHRIRLSGAKGPAASGAAGSDVITDSGLALFERLGHHVPYLRRLEFDAFSSRQSAIRVGDHDEANRGSRRYGDHDGVITG